MKKSFILIEGCNYIDYPLGGQLSFAKQLLKVYGNEVKLVGITTNENTEIGKWTKLIIDGISYDFFPYRRVLKSSHKPFLPARLSDYMALKKYKKSIMDKNENKLFVQAPEILFACLNWNWEKIIFRSAGVENPVKYSRYKLLKKLSKLYDFLLFNSLKNVDKILASADDIAIKEFISRSSGKLDEKKVVKFPTRIDTNIFKYKDKNNLRNQYTIELKTKIFLVIGRLNFVKGWDLIINSFKIYNSKNNNSILYFIGEGEDEESILNKIKKEKLSDNIFLLGRKKPEEISDYINLSDTILVGSIKEGWSISMVESLACGAKVLSTEVSGTSEMIKDGVNGYVCKNRDPEDYSDYMKKSLLLPDNKEFSISLVSKYSTEKLKNVIEKLWS